MFGPAKVFVNVNLPDELKQIACADTGAADGERECFSTLHI